MKIMGPEVGLPNLNPGFALTNLGLMGKGINISVFVYYL